jgi:catechol 2,3-dioxygenase-like lactoylglutathione lyase family enzyme
MTRRIGHVALLVREYDEAIDFFVGTLGFELLHDDFLLERNKRWVTDGRASRRQPKRAAAR